MFNPLVSIIIPVYNATKYLNKCLDSLIAQTYSHIEILCVNDGSTDNSLDVLNAYSERDVRIKIINKQNEGASIARNVALKEAKGEYITFVDADDWIDLETIEVAIDKAKTGVDIVLWGYMREFATRSAPRSIFDYDEKIFEKDEVDNLRRSLFGFMGKELKYVEKADSLCMVGGKLYKKSLILDNGIQFVDIREIGTFEDGIFCIDVLSVAKSLLYIDKFFYHYRKDNENSVTTKYKENFFQKWCRLFEKLQKKIEKEKLGEEYQIALKNRISLCIIGQGLNIIEGNFSAREKIKKIKEILTFPLYRQAIKQFKLRYLKIHCCLFFLCAKIRFSLGVYILLVLIKKLK